MTGKRRIQICNKFNLGDKENVPTSRRLFHFNLLRDELARSYRTIFISFFLILKKLKSREVVYPSKTAVMFFVARGIVLELYLVIRKSYLIYLFLLLFKIFYKLIDKRSRTLPYYICGKEKRTIYLSHAWFKINRKVRFQFLEFSIFEPFDNMSFSYFWAPGYDRPRFLSNRSNLLHIRRFTIMQWM